MSYFDFKQFRIHHDQCAMKVGTDGVLLGAWAKIHDQESVLDIGTGTGLIAIMLAQRANAHIVGVEIDPSAATQAMENVESCPFHDHIEIFQSDIQSFEPTTLFDNIVSNPPFYKEEVLPPTAARATARHCQGLPLETLVAEAKKRLKPEGLFQVILPHSEVSHFTGLCALNEMSLLRQTDVFTKTGKSCKRTLFCFINHIEATQPIRDSLVLSGPDGKRSEAYQALTEDFYIK